MVSKDAEKLSRGSRTSFRPGGVLGAIALAVCLSGLAAFAGQRNAAQPDQTGDQSQPPANQPVQQTIQQGPDDPQSPQGRQQGQAPYPGQPPYNDQQDSQQGPPPNVAAPLTLVIPQGALITVRTSQWLSSDQNQPNDSFSATLHQPLVADGWVLARRGQTVLGRVAVAEKAGRVKGVSQLGVELTEITLVDGQQVHLHTQMIQNSAGTSRITDAAAMGTTTGLGAAIGAAANGGKGAAIGAGAGAVAGIVGVLATRGRPTVIYPETVLTFRLESPVNVSTERGTLAFQPVTQADYDQATLRHRPPNGPPPNYAPYPPYYAAYPPPYYYPQWGPGFYGWGWGPSIYIGGFRGGWGRGYRYRR